MEKTLIIIKPCAIQRELVGEIIKRFERKGLQLSGIKMVELTEDILREHYSHLVEQPFFKRIKDSMMASPVIVSCWMGRDAVELVRKMTGSTNGRDAIPGTIRGDYSISTQENIIHTSDSIEAAEIELKRFFKPEEIFHYKTANSSFIYSNEEL